MAKASYDCLNEYIEDYPTFDEEEDPTVSVRRGPSAGDLVTMFKCGQQACEFTCNFSNIDAAIITPGDPNLCSKNSQPA